jgi:hypothetical protein
MDLVNIKTWASNEIKKIGLSQIYLNAPYQVEVREFEPVEGDMLEEKWTTNGITKTHRIPPYALADMEKSAAVMQAFIQNGIATYIYGTVKDSDPLIWETYVFAFTTHAENAKVSCWFQVNSVLESSLIITLPPHRHLQRRSWSSTPSGSGLLVGKPATPSTFSATTRSEPTEWTIRRACSTAGCPCQSS